MLERFESAAAVRPTLLQEGPDVLLFRNGSQRIMPLNLVIHRDPDELRHGPFGISAEQA